MKRKASNTQLPLSKRIKTERTRNFDDGVKIPIPRLGTVNWTDETRLVYVEGYISTINDVKGGGKRLYLKETHGSEVLEVQFTHKAATELLNEFRVQGGHALALKAGDELKVALRGAEKLSPSPATRYGARFMEGFRLQVVNCAKEPTRNGRVLDTWNDDWSGSSPNVDTPPTPQATSPAPSRQQSPDEPADTAQRKRDEKKRLRAAEHARKTAQPANPPDTPKSTHPPLTPPQTITKPSQTAPIAISQPSVTNEEPPLALKAGLTLITGTYVPLCQANRPVFNAIGVVRSVKAATQTDTGDWNTTLELTDPSLLLEGTTTADRVKVNMFMVDPAWLPLAEQGDIVILRDLKVSARNRTPVGYKDRLKWAIYRPQQGTLHHVLEGVVKAVHSKRPGPRSENRLTTHSPIYEPTPVEIDYCRRLGKWWDAVQTLDPATTHQVVRTVYVSASTRYPPGHSGASTGYIAPRPGPSRLPAGSSRTPRKHELICDVRPDSETGGYFDATVELLHRFDVDNMTSLHVTDYTKNEHLYASDSYGARWCPDNLRSGYVLCIEATYRAHDFVRHLEIGGIYRFQNLRIKESSNGTWEGRQVENKIKLLSEADRERDVHLKNFLVRREVWREEYELRDRQERAIASVKDLSNAAKDKMFTCVTEVIEYNDVDQTLFVTDYTRSNILISSTNVGGLHLDGYVMPIRIDDDTHLEDAQALKPGDYCLVENVKIIKTYSGNVRGYLQKQDISPLSKVTREGAHKGQIERIISRKQKVYNALQTRKAAPVVKPQKTEDHKLAAAVVAKPITSIAAAPLAEAVSKQLCSYGKIDIHTLIRSDDIGRFRVTARLITMSHRLRDAVVALCKKCEQVIPSSQKACVGCNDAEHEYVHHLYRFILRLGHEGNHGLMVFINDESPLLHGLKRVSLHDDEEAYDAFCARMMPIMGPFDKWETDESPTWDFLIKTCRNVDNERVHFLQGHLPVDS